MLRARTNSMGAMKGSMDEQVAHFVQRSDARRPSRAPMLLASAVVVSALLVWTAHRASRYMHHNRIRASRAASARLPPRTRTVASAAVRKHREILQNTGEAPKPPLNQRSRELARLEKLTEPFTWQGLLALGDAYARGSYPYLSPDESVAEDLYRECSRAPDPEVAGLAQQRFVELRVNGSMIAQADRNPNAPSVPRSIADAAKRAANVAAQQASYQSRPRWFRAREIQRPRSVFAPQNGGGDGEGVGGHRTRRRDDGTAMGMFAAMQQRVFPATRAAPADDAADEVDVHRIDTQNVHDHTVARTVRNNLAKVGESLQTGERVCGREAARQATDFLLTSDSWNGVEKADALDVIDALNDSPNESAGVSQLGALSTVWSATHRIQCPQRRRNVRETLIDQLRSAKENGNVVCSTGRIARIASALDGIDTSDVGVDLQTAKPMWVVRQEIASLAARTRAECEGLNSNVDDTRPGRGGDDGDDDDDADEGTAAASLFRKRAQQEYIDKLKFSKAILDPLINEYAEHL